MEHVRAGPSWPAADASWSPAAGYPVAPSSRFLLDPCSRHRRRFRCRRTGAAAPRSALVDGAVRTELIANLTPDAWPSSPWSSPARASGPSSPACRRRRQPVSRSGVMSSWRGRSTGHRCTDRLGRGWWSPAPTARRPPPRCSSRFSRPPALTVGCLRKHRPPGARRAAPRRASMCWRSNCRPSSCSGRRRCVRRPAWCSTSPRIISTGTAGWTPTSRPSFAAVGAESPWSVSTIRSRRGLAGRVDRADRQSGSGWTHPSRVELGVVDGQMVDRAFGRRRRSLARHCRHRAARLRQVCSMRSPRRRCRAVGVPAAAVADGLDPFASVRTEQRRCAISAASRSSTTRRRPIPTPRGRRSWHTTGWCGSPAGLLKGAVVDDLVVGCRGRLVAAVVFGRPRPDRRCNGATRPDVPVVVHDGRRCWSGRCY